MVTATSENYKKLYDQQIKIRGGAVWVMLHASCDVNPPTSDEWKCIFRSVVISWLLLRGFLVDKVLCRMYVRNLKSSTHVLAWLPIFRQINGEC